MKVCDSKVQRKIFLVSVEQEHWLDGIKSKVEIPSEELSKEQEKQIIELKAKGLTQSKIGKMVGCSQSTVWDVIRREAIQ